MNIKDFKCNPSGSCWCMDIPYKIEIESDTCLNPNELIEKIKQKYNLNEKQIKKLKRMINEKNKSI